MIFEGVCEPYEATLVELDGEGDHVHLLVHYPPKTSISKLVNSLKMASSRVIRKDRKPPARGRDRVALYPRLSFARFSLSQDGVLRLQ